MILYFSGTGNTKYVANLLASELNDEVVNLLPMIKSGEQVVIDSKRPFILCFPAYIMDIPVFIREFLQRTRLQGNKLVYAVITCAAESGIAGNSIKEIVEKQGKVFGGSCDVIMANNYTVNTRFDSTPDKEIVFRIEEAKLDVKRIAMFIKNKHFFMLKKVSTAKKLMVRTVVSVYTNTSQSSELFHTSDKCIGCGKCVSLCPVNKIHLDSNKHPTWDKMCMHCMSCINNCPVEAIDYGNVTQHKAKYNINKFLDKE